MDTFDKWWNSTVFSVSLKDHKATARAAFEAATSLEQEKCKKDYRENSYKRISSYEQ